MKMNDNVRTWLRDLRSGEYEQGKGLLVSYLPSGTFYCCLGVACLNADVGLSERCVLTDGERGHLSLGIIDQTVLATLNEEHGFSFSEIADVVEQAATRGCSIYDICLELLTLGHQS